MPNVRTGGSDQFVEELILTVRGRRVILAGDLAGIYGVDAKRLNEQVRRSGDRFPEDFVFRLAQEEFEVPRTRGMIGADGRVALRSQNATLKRGQYVKYPGWTLPQLELRLDAGTDYCRTREQVLTALRYAAGHPPKGCAR